MDNVTEEFGDVIYGYTAEQAIEDGVFVRPIPEWPDMLLTASVRPVREAGYGDRQGERPERQIARSVSYIGTEAP